VEISTSHSIPHLRQKNISKKRSKINTNEIIKQNRKITKKGHNKMVPLYTVLSGPITTKLIERKIFSSEDAINDQWNQTQKK